MQDAASTMVKIDAEYVPATIPDDQRYEGTDLDENILAAMPTGTTIEWVATHGASFWAITTKIDTKQEDGSEQSYFLKVYTTANAEEMAVAEYESTKALNTVQPENIAKAIAHGTFSTDPNKHFFLAEFRDMSDELPPVPELVSIVVDIHKKSQGQSDKFGFHVTSVQGDLPCDNTWCSTWEEWFDREMRLMMSRELEIQGPHEELEALSEKVLSKVIPRLLRPLETGGRSIKPTLVHGDLWHGNVGIDLDTDEPVLYDPCALYAHCECSYSLEVQVLNC